MTTKRTYAVIEKEIADLDSLRGRLQQELLEAAKRQTVRCGWCKGVNKIKDIALTQRTQYHEPEGCSGGDYTTARDDYSFECSKCQETCRFYSSCESSYNESRRDWVSVHTHWEGQRCDGLKLGSIVNKHASAFLEVVLDYQRKKK